MKKILLVLICFLCLCGCDSNSNHDEKELADTSLERACCTDAGGFWDWDNSECGAASGHEDTYDENGYKDCIK